MKERFISYVDMFLADENKIAEYNDEDTLQDRAQFVKNIGLLLSQTRKEIRSVQLDRDDIAYIVYNSGRTKEVDVYGDSYFDILKDIVSVVDITYMY